MKKITLVVGLATLSFGALAQNWVSTAPQNKKVVIEEFTGLHCTFCPDGHKTANALVTANPGNVFTVNIHSGGYATPATGEPDMRTTKGDAIDDASGLKGYPAASVNRYRTPRAEPGNRASWAASVNSQLAESAAANAYVKSYFDRTTNELTTEVEVYYTANSATSTNKLTVMLLQDDILGPQTGGTQFYPENFVGDDYIHNHVLRDVISGGGAWGEVIDTTTQGTYYYKKYVTTLPASIKNVPLKFFNLQVLAFVSEGDDNNIMAAHQTDVEYDQTGLVDLSMISKTTEPSSICTDPFTPSIEVTNTSTETVTSFDISATIEGVNVNKSFSGSIAPNGKTTISFDDEIAPRGNYSVNIIGFTNINAGVLTDIDVKNDFVKLSGLGLQKKAFSYTKFSMDGTMDLNSGRMVDQNTGYVLVESGGHTRGAIRFSIHESWGLTGLPGELVFGEADFSDITDPQVSYYYAYSDGNEAGSAPSITVSISEDCGANFTEVNSFDCIETGQPAAAGQWYLPTSGEYKKVTVDLSAYAGKQVIVNIAGIPGAGGNALYIDEVEIGSSAKIATINSIELEGVSIFPNPANEVINIVIEEGTAGTITLRDINGRLISNSSFLNGKTSVNTEDFVNGIYFIQVETAKGSTTKKVILTK
mgnify:FL=1